MSYFTPLTDRDIPSLSAFFGQNPHRFCDFTAYNTWIWGKYLHAALATFHGITILRRNMMDERTCLYPLGVSLSKEGVLSCLLEVAKKEGISPTLFPLTREEKDYILTLYPQSQAETQEGWWDYLYLRDDLANLSGKKYHGQRNFLRRFRTLYPPGKCVPLDEVKKDDVAHFLAQFYQNPPASGTAVEAEMVSLLSLLSSPLPQGMSGMALTTGEDIVALALGEVVGDTLYIHIEKARRTCPGAYQAIVHGFASAHEGVLYINREEDDGNEGLRTSKLSYHPKERLQKWAVTISAPPCI